MDFDEAASFLKDLPYTDPSRGRRFYNWVLNNKPECILELGFAQGASTCYMAAALEEIGRGHITTIDRVEGQESPPRINILTHDMGLDDYVTPIFAERSHTWELMKLIEANDEPVFDFVFHDGGHTWDVAGYAFFLADRLIKPGGWMLFDDLTWKVATSKGLANSRWAREVPEEERNTAQVGKVFDLLVARHPDYIDTKRELGGSWGWARKRPT